MTAGIRRLFRPVPRRLRALLRFRHALQKDVTEQPLRSELYSAGQMEQHGEALADSHKDARRHGPDRLLPRLAEISGVGRSKLDRYGAAVIAVVAAQAAGPTHSPEGASGDAAGNDGAPFFARAARRAAQGNKSCSRPRRS